jgi:hypothetical protein
MERFLKPKENRVREDMGDQYHATGFMLYSASTRARIIAVEIPAYFEL